MIYDIVQSIIADVNTNVTLSDTLILDNTPEDGGITVQFDTGLPVITDISKNHYEAYPLAFFRKSRNQKICINELDSIQQYLVKLSTEYIRNNFGAIDIVYDLSPTKVDKYEDDNFIYTMVVEVRNYR